MANNVVQMRQPAPHFELGRLYFTQGAQALPLDRVVSVIGRHHRCDWGILCEQDCLINKATLTQEQQQFDDPVDGPMMIGPTNRLFSAYEINGEKVYVITEPMLDNIDYPRTTTVLLASEY